jgi:hypothetical protein
VETLLILYALFSLLLIGLSIPLIQNKIKPNGLYGFRVRATLEDPSVWYAVNKYFAKRLFVTGFVLLIASLLLYQVPGISVDAYALGVLFVFCLFIIPSIVVSFRYIHRLRRP